MLMRRITMFIGLVAALIAAMGMSLVAAETEQVQLQYVVPENETQVYEMISTTSLDFGEGLGMPMSETLEQRVVFSIDFGEKSEDETTPFTYRMLEINMFGMDLIELMNEMDPEGAEELEGLFHEFSGRMHPDGRIAEMKFAPGLADLEELSLDLDSMLQDLAVPFPDEMLAVGDSWQVTQDIDLGEVMPEIEFSDFTQETTFTLLAFDTAANTATIESIAVGAMKAEIIMTPDDDPTLTESLHMTIEIEMEIEGIMEIELTTGQLNSSRMMVLQLTHLSLPAMPGLSDQPETMTLPTLMETEIRRIEP